MAIHKLTSAAGASLEIHDHGAHITSWRATDGIERLFLSQRAEFRPDAAIRGGVPIIFPQFAGLGPFPKHGFARTAQWQRVTAPNAALDSALFRLQDSEATRSVWPQSFVAEYRVALGQDSLSMTLSIHNTGTQPYSFTAALHTYLRVQDIAEVSIAGLQGLTYSDSAAGSVSVVERAINVRIAGEVDRIYFATSTSMGAPIQVCELGQRTIVCTAEGFADAVIWNPGADKGAALSDLEPQGYRHMLCVEAAAIGQPVVLPPQASWSGTQHLRLI